MAKTQPLPIPSILTPKKSRGRNLITLEANQRQHNFSHELTSKSLGYNEMSYLGPTLHFFREERVHICLKNNLSEDTSFHWHGGHIFAEEDGGRPIAPGKTWSGQYLVNQPASTTWYHPQIMGHTARQMYEGLGGLCIVDDDRQSPLPHHYGVDDIPLIIQDRTFDHQGRMIYPRNPGSMNGNTGRVFITNGVVFPHFDVNNRFVRFRLVNGSNLSIYRFFFPNGMPFQLIATDGSLLEKPVVLDELLLSSGERAEVVVDFFAFDRGETQKLMIEEYFSRHLAKVLLLKVSEVVDRGSFVLPHLVSFPPLHTPEHAPQHIMMTTTSSYKGGLLVPESKFTVNGKPIEGNHTDLPTFIHRSEMWVVENHSGPMRIKMPYSFHLHGRSFRIVTINGVPPLPHLAGWKDTLLLWSESQVCIIIEFDNVSGTYCYHCRMLEQDTEGVMGYVEGEHPKHG